MFYNASYLEDGPAEIPATSTRVVSSNTRLACGSMFYGCSRLKRAVPRLSFDSAQYGEMYRGCGLIEEPPSSSTTKFNNAANCCQQMFASCSKLRRIPVLRVLTPVAGDNYSGGLWYMFGSSTQATAIRFDTVHSDDVPYEWSIPPLESGTDHSLAFYRMLGGTTVTRGVKYYFSEPPVE